MDQSDTVWQDISNNPVSLPVHEYLRETLLGAKNSDPALGYRDFLRRRISGRSVLDIGVVEHDLTHMEDINWIHQLVKSHGSRVVGVDILAEGVDELCRRGFDVRLIDATSNVDLAEKFDVVHIGDVIEHVDNPVALLSFAKRHLTEGGEIVVKTPNPFYYKFSVRGLREGVVVANAEHVSWVSPCLALELGTRAGLVLDQYWLLRGPPRGYAKKVLRLASDRWTRNAEFATPDFVYLFRHAV